MQEIYIPGPVRPISDQDIAMFRNANTRDERIIELRDAMALLMQTYELPFGVDSQTEILTHLDVLKIKKVPLEIAIIAYKRLLLNNPTSPKVPKAPYVAQVADEIEGDVWDACFNFFFAGVPAEKSPYLDKEIGLAANAIGRKCFFEAIVRNTGQDDDGNSSSDNLLLAIVEQMTPEKWKTIPKSIFQDFGPASHGELSERIEVYQKHRELIREALCER